MDTSIAVRTDRGALRAHLTLYNDFRIIINDRAAIRLTRTQPDELIIFLAALARSLPLDPPATAPPSPSLGEGPGVRDDA